MVTFITGKPGSGKTSVALGLAAVLLSQKKKVAYVTTGRSWTSVANWFADFSRVEGLKIYTEMKPNFFLGSDIEEWIFDGIHPSSELLDQAKAAHKHLRSINLDWL